MTTAASGDSDARPPVEQKPAAFAPEAAVRPTARVRPRLPVRIERVDSGVAPDDPYVRRFWVAAIGPSAVAELLRLVRAGADSEQVPLPRWLPLLLRCDLVRIEDGAMVVPSRLPLVPTTLQRRFPPGLREQHRRAHDVRSRP